MLIHYILKLYFRYLFCVCVWAGEVCPKDCKNPEEGWNPPCLVIENADQVTDDLRISEAS